MKKWEEVTTEAVAQGQNRLPSSQLLAARKCYTIVGGEERSHGCFCEEANAAYWRLLEATAEAWLWGYCWTVRGRDVREKRREGREGGIDGSFGHLGFSRVLYSLLLLSLLLLLLLLFCLFIIRFIYLFIFLSRLIFLWDPIKRLTFLGSHILKNKHFYSNLFI